MRTPGFFRVNSDFFFKVKPFSFRRGFGKSPESSEKFRTPRISSGKIRLYFDHLERIRNNPDLFRMNVFRPHNPSNGEGKLFPYSSHVPPPSPSLHHCRPYPSQTCFLRRNCRIFAKPGLGPLWRGSTEGFSSVTWIGVPLTSPLSGVLSSSFVLDVSSR